MHQEKLKISFQLKTIPIVVQTLQIGLFTVVYNAGYQVIPTLIEL